jgi:hypothetical protein
MTQPHAAIPAERGCKLGRLIGYTLLALGAALALNFPYYPIAALAVLLAYIALLYPDFDTG